MISKTLSNLFGRSHVLAETGCHFIPHVTDCGFAVIMEDDERFETLETIVRRRYCVEESTLMVITYGIPDWMLSLSGKTPPK
ncbi:hypothetical protein Bca52824_040393 [Brassica carinata]|uniref:Uncharacterized protein n=1 Tax=Brassica carinata TaxID=52824 RepID=A0A8X7RXQ8_BRACI|nr:hypothetical protein Bca52824_040393 [Brassica carinata]